MANIFELSIKKLNKGSAIALLATISLCMNSAAFAWDMIADPATGCKVENNHPMPKQSISWSGKCENGMANGVGTLQWLGAGKLIKLYEGSMKDGIASGYGTLTWSFNNGPIYKGEFKDGVLFSGVSMLPHSNGHVSQSEWKEGKQVGDDKETTTTGAVLAPLDDDSVSSTASVSEGLVTFLDILGTVAQGYADVKIAKNEQRAAALAQQREQAQQQQALQAQQLAAAYAQQERQAAQFDLEQQQRSALAQQQAVSNKVATGPTPAQTEADRVRYFEKVEKNRNMIEKNRQNELQLQRFREANAAIAANDKAKAEQIAQRALAQQQQQADAERKKREYWDNQRQIEDAEKNALQRTINAEVNNPNIIRTDEYSCGASRASMRISNLAHKAFLKGYVSWRVTGTPLPLFEPQGNQGFTLGPGEGIIVGLTSVDCNQPWSIRVLNKNWSTF